jgi:hypothetical protein
MLRDAVLTRFLAHRPMAVAVRGTREYAPDPAHLDALLVRSADRRADREPLFSTAVDRMAAVVSRAQPPVRAAYQGHGSVPVGVTAPYARLARAPRRPSGTSSGTPPTAWPH